MPRTPKGTPPSYRKHSSGQAVVTVRLTDGRRKDMLLGPYDSPESHEEYSRILGILARNQGRYPVDPAEVAPGTITVNEVLLLWLKNAEAQRGPGDKELKQYKYSLRPVKELFGAHPAAEFSPKCLRTVLRRMVELGWCRTVINRRLSRVKAVFGWAVAEELIPATVAYGLREVKGFRRGDKQVRESEPRAPAFFEEVATVVPHCPRPVAAMLQLQWLTAMRSGEVRIMRPMDIDQSNPNCWLYRPGSDAGPNGAHKNSWRGQDRVIPLGPQCIEIITPFLRPDDPAAFLFSPRDSVEDRNAKRRSERRTPLTPSQKKRKRKAKPRRAAGACYTDESYPRAVARACAKAGVTFSPYALRHGRKMDIERTAGSEAARCVLGQKSIEATQHYGRLDVARAAEVLGKIG